MVRTFLFLADSSVGESGINTPLQPFPYTFGQALREAGVQAEILAVGRFSPDRRGKRPPKWWSTYVDIARHLRYIRKFDVVFGHGSIPVFLIAASKLGMLGRTWIWGFRTANHSGHSSRLRLYVDKLARRAQLRNADRTFYVIREQLEEALLDCHECSKTVYLRFGVDTHFYSPQPDDTEEVEDEFRRFAKEPFIAVAGDQIRDESAIAGLLAAGDLRLIRLTTNKYTEEFWRNDLTARSLQGRVLCRARVSWDTVRFVYQHAQALVSYADSSWQPAGITTALEAMACGTPALIPTGMVTRELNHYVQSGGPRPFIELPDWSNEAVMGALIPMLADPDYSRRAGDAAREFVQRYFDIRKTARVVLQTLGVSE
jgi:glycosyltransferase involved in cell wall biosynthesis